jgi:DNA-binding transcriptional MocR family regulator
MPNVRCTAATTPFVGCRSPSVRVGSQISKCVQYEGALFNFLAAFTSPGNVVLTEPLTYPGIKAAAAYTGVRLVGVPIDEKGTIPDELDSACRQHAPRAVYLIPTIDNSTTATMPLSRRKEVAEILRHKVLLFEDDAYRKLEPNAVPLASLVPERTHFRCEPFQVHRARAAGVPSPNARPSVRRGLVSALPASVQMPAFPMVPLFTRWLQDGSTDAIIGAILNEAPARQRLAADVLVQHAYSRHPNGHPIWVLCHAIGVRRNSRRMFKGNGWLS